MSASDWTLESELAKLAGKRDPARALSALGLLPSESTSYTLITLADWVRSGSETYLYHFGIETSGAGIREYVIKACVALAVQSDISTVLERWIARRKLLQDAGVSVPVLVTWGEGVLIEEYVPLTLNDALAASGADARLLHGLAEYAGILSGYGFAAISPFSDLRSRGHDVVAVDFGQDLGEPGVVEPGSTGHLEALREFLKKHGVDERLTLASIFEGTVRRIKQPRQIS